MGTYLYPYFSFSGTFPMTETSPDLAVTFTKSQMPWFAVPMAMSPLSSARVLILLPFPEFIDIIILPIY